jgi:hypothetical protein
VTEASHQVIYTIWGFMASQALHAAARLAVFDIVRDGPKTAREIAGRSSSSEPPLLRLLRYLTAIGFLTEDAQGRFSSTPLGALLQADHPQSLRPMALMYGEPFWWRPWGGLYETVKDGRPAFDRIYSEGLFDYLSHTPTDAATFNACMTSGTSVDLRAILSAYDFSGLSRIVDVAGGHGALLVAILEQYPECSGVLADMPSVIKEAAGIMTSPAGSRCELVAADIFESVPPGSDAYILKRILHDWSDDDSVRILANCRSAMAPSGRVLVIEQVIQPSNQPDAAKWMDLNMLVMARGRERTVEEFAALYERAGLKLSRVVPAGRFAIVEGLASAAYFS